MRRHVFTVALVVFSVVSGIAIGQNAGREGLLQSDADWKWYSDHIESVEKQIATRTSGRYQIISVRDGKIIALLDTREGYVGFAHVPTVDEVLSPLPNYFVDIVSNLETRMTISNMQTIEAVADSHADSVGLTIGLMGRLRAIER